MALSVPLSRFTSRVGGGSAFFVRQCFLWLGSFARSRPSKSLLHRSFSILVSFPLAANSLSDVDAHSRVFCPGGVGFETSSANGRWGAGLVAMPTRPVIHGVGAKSFGVSAPERDSPEVFAPGGNHSDDQSAFASDGRFIPIVTKLGCWNGAASWAECSGGGVRSRGCLGASQSFGLRRHASWLKVWRGGG